MHLSLAFSAVTASMAGCFYLSPCFLLAVFYALLFAPAHGLQSARESRESSRLAQGFRGAVASDDGRCSSVGSRVLQNGGNAVDAAVASLLCLGVVSPVASGIGGGAFLLLRLADGPALAYDMREVSPAAASEDMYGLNPDSQVNGALSVAVPGEVAGLHLVWQQYGRLPWKSLFLPAIRLAEKGFVVSPYMAISINTSARAILADTGLREVFAPNGTLLRAGDICFRKALAKTLRSVADEGPETFYTGSVGRNLVADVQAAGGILTTEDLASYRVKIRKPLEENILGLTILGMPPPSSGGACTILIFNILAAYENPKHAVRGALGLHRMIEAFKHAYAVRMHLGDPDFVNVTAVLADMLSPAFASELKKKISDRRTFPPEYYGGRWGQLNDHGTSHLSVVDEDRNAVSVTSTVNYPFGAKLLSRSTGILLNNEMGDFSIPANSTEGMPPSPANYIRPGKRPLSSMAPTIVLKDGELVGVLGGSGGSKIITAVAQAFLNRFWKGYSPLQSVLHPRFHHQLIPNVVDYENWTTVSGYRIEAAKSLVESLREKGDNVTGTTGAITQLILQEERSKADAEGSTRKGKLIAVSDVRKDGIPAAF